MLGTYLELYAIYMYIAFSYKKYCTNSKGSSMYVKMYTFSLYSRLLLSLVSFIDRPISFGHFIYTTAV